MTSTELIRYDNFALEVHDHVVVLGGKTQGITPGPLIVNTVAELPEYYVWEFTFRVVWPK